MVEGRRKGDPPALLVRGFDIGIYFESDSKVGFTASDNFRGGVGRGRGHGLIILCFPWTLRLEFEFGL